MGKKNMGQRGVGSVLVVCLVLGLLIGQSTASFGSCYKECFISCVVTPGKNPISCGASCVKQCILNSSPLAYLEDTQYFCKLGCSTSMCATLSSKHDPDEARVESCVDSCTERCTTNS